MNTTYKSTIAAGLLALIGLLISPLSWAHEGHDHGTEEKSTSTETMMLSRTEVHNERYEILLKFTPVEPGDSLHMKLYLSDYASNKPVSAERMALVNLGKADQRFEVQWIEPGVYAVHTIMPDEVVYSLRVSAQIQGEAQQFELASVDFTHHHLGSETAHEHSHFWMYVAGFGVLLLGLILGRYTAVRKYNKHIAILVLLVYLPLMHMDSAMAHEGHDQAPVKQVPKEGNHFELAKESQFLMQIYTQFLGETNYQDGRKLYGTIIPASGGQSHIVLPQHARVVQLQVQPGQKVSKGAVLATLERSVDPVNEMLIASERNRLTEEVKRLQKEVERLRSVGDIVSKKELEGAESAYATVSSNLELYQSTGRTLTIKAPISGVVSPFTYQVGDLVNGGVELFVITNIDKVYVETQAFEKDVAMISQASHFLAQCADGNHSTDRIRLLSLGSEFNSANQSQKVLFEVDNISGDFKLGEFVNVWTYLPAQEQVMAIPNSAITELQGRPVVFVKHHAEDLELRYVALGRNNGQITVIENGLKSGERFVTEGAYQCKLVYLNQ
jgi:membrane fusion protein, heavy metal efflux system